MGWGWGRGEGVLLPSQNKTPDLFEFVDLCKLGQLCYDRYCSFLKSTAKNTAVFVFMRLILLKFKLS